MEVNDLLALVNFDDFAQEALPWNPVQTPCQLLATDAGKAVEESFLMIGRCDYYILLGLEERIENRND